MSSMTAREVLAHTDLAALLTSLSGPPVGTGRSARWLCFSPDHPDEHPSVTMFVDRKGIERWRCWSDGHAGTAIDAVMIGHNLDVPGALRWLQERAGHLPEPPPRVRPPRRPARHQRRCAAGRTTASIACGAPKAPVRSNGSGGAAWTTRCCGPTASASTPAPALIGRPRGLPRWRGVTVCSYDRAGELAYVQVRNLDARAPSKYSNPTPQHGSLPAVTFPRGAPAAVPSSCPKASSTG